VTVKWQEGYEPLPEKENEPEYLKSIKYAIFGDEVGDGGYRHWQGYIELKSPTRLAGVKKLLHRTDAHLEIRRGSREEARDYCKKEGQWREVGVWQEGGQGERTDFKAALKSVAEGKSLIELFETHPSVMIRYGRGIEKYRAMKTLQVQRQKGFTKKRVIVLFGEAGRGKTRLAVELAGGIDYFILPPSNSGNLWWDGYNGEKTIIVNEADERLPLRFMLELLDGYPMQLNTKGGMVVCEAETVIMTANQAVTAWFPHATVAHQQALYRRITDIAEFPDNDTLVTHLASQSDLVTLAQPDPVAPEGATVPGGPQVTYNEPDPCPDDDREPKNIPTADAWILLGD